MTLYAPKANRDRPREPNGRLEPIAGPIPSRDSPLRREMRARLHADIVRHKARLKEAWRRIYLELTLSNYENTARFKTRICIEYLEGASIEELAQENPKCRTPARVQAILDEAKDRKVLFL